MTFSYSPVLTLVKSAWLLGLQHFPQSYSQLLWINNLSPAQLMRIRNPKSSIKHRLLAALQPVDDLIIKNRYQSS